MAFGALRFISLTFAAVVLGVMSAAVAFGQFGLPNAGFDPAASAAAQAVAGDMVRNDETPRSLRHITRSK